MKRAKKLVEEIINDSIGGALDEDLVERSTRIDVKGRFGEICVATGSFDAELGFEEGGFADYFQANAPILGGEFERFEVKGNFINFFLDRSSFVQRTLQAIINEGWAYGSNKLGEGKLAVFDYSAPNVGKPLHVGHIRSTILGDSIIRLMKFSGYRTHGINYVGDVGLHIGKILHAYKDKGDAGRLKTEPEKELLELYVDFCTREKDDPALTRLAQEQVRLVEQEDEETLLHLKIITESSFAAFDRVYDLLDIEIDETAGQSLFSEKGKGILFDSLEKGLVEKTDDGAIMIELEDHGLPNKVLLRSDGTAIYSTQDVGAAVSRFEEHEFDRMLYVVGESQAGYFRQIFKTLELLGYDWADRCEHIGFGLINLKEGKMATRDGVIVYLEELLQKAIARSSEIIEEKNPELKDKETVARHVGVGAVKYQVLSVDKLRDINFSWEAALNFNGKSGPNIQYTYARAGRILEKAGVGFDGFDSADLVGNAEFSLIKQMAYFPIVVEEALGSLRPNHIANYAYGLSTQFNQFYGSVKVLQDPQKLPSRLQMIESYRMVLSNAMGLLGISMPEEM